MEWKILSLDPGEVFDTLARLRREENYNLLVDITAVDYSTEPELHPKPARFDVVYRVARIDAATGLEAPPRVEIHTGVGEEPLLRSVASLWPTADWLERELWDMFGIRFADRPDIRRLLLYESFVGHPLRKDYPIDRRQPLIGPPRGEPLDNPSFTSMKPTVRYE